MFTTLLKSKPDEDICLLFKVANHHWNYLCECGEASELTVKECQNTHAIFISHTHIDHFINFDRVLRHQIGIQRRVVICGPEGISAQVQAKIKGYCWNLIEEGSVIYEIREIISFTDIQIYELKPPDWELKKIGQITDGFLFQNDKFVTRFTLLDHKIPTIAYHFKAHDSINIHLENSGFEGGRWINDLKEAFLQKETERIIEVQNNTYQAGELFHLIKKNRGETFGIIMDHAASPENHRRIQSLFQDCDKVFIECFYQAADKEMAAANFHSYSTESARIMRESAVKLAIPVHFSRRYEAKDLEIIKAEFQKEFAGAG